MASGGRRRSVPCRGSYEEVLGFVRKERTGKPAAERSYNIPIWFYETTLYFFYIKGFETSFLIDSKLFLIIGVPKFDYRFEVGKALFYYCLTVLIRLYFGFFNLIYTVLEKESRLFIYNFKGGGLAVYLYNN
ncbi:hypothetical protein B0T20DRAFT_392034 [Sordaria brevicollis]|uniref:Uncharacterized protein n=1 Tax=Sordaria brevicollis TaxID=83679 RepID=A0AAE0UCF6_SORBR|nr:hypothetical protein B0T20DRAFT_392034 [Sordaria brevicollis]